MAHATRVPASHADLLQRPLSVALTTEMPDGRLQSTVVWFSVDGDDVLLNTMREFRKAENLLERPRATILVQEPPPGSRWIEIRADVVPQDTGAAEHLDDLARAYTGAERYFGEVVPTELAATEHPILFRLRPRVVTVGPSRGPAPHRRLSDAALPPEGRGCEDDVVLPDSHRELLAKPVLAVLATHLPDGSAQTHPVWFMVEGRDVLVSTTLERTKGRNLLRDPRATLLVVDPEDDGRWLEIRGDAELERTGAEQVLDRLTSRYTKHPRFYGSIYPEERRERETRVTVRVHPVRVNRDAIH